MSDQPPQAGWWQASDGNWYPPDAHPAAQTPTPMTPTGPAADPPATDRRSNRGCLLALGALAVLAVIAIGGIVAAAVFVNRTVDEALDDGGIPGLLGGDCLRFQAAFTTLTFTGILGAGGDDEQQAQLDESLGELRQLAPAEIRDDVEVVGSAIGEAMQTVTGGGLVTGDQPSEEQSRQAEQILESPEVEAARSNIDAWVSDNCG